MGLMNILLVGPMRVLLKPMHYFAWAERKRVYSHGILFISGVQFIQIKFQKLNF